MIVFSFLTSLAPAPAWNVDTAKAKITFIIDGPFGKVDGSFKGLKATIVFDEKDIAHSSIAASIDVNTIETGIALRNKDLLTQEEWFEPAKYPGISFKSTSFEKTKTGYAVTGDLTLKASTKQVRIPFTFTQNKNSALLKGKFTINREDYGLGQSKTVGKEIIIFFEVPVKK